VHSFKDIIGKNTAEFEGKRNAINILKDKILESAQAAFQQKTFIQFNGMPL
jgi:hypothetical protein